MKENTPINQNEGIIYDSARESFINRISMLQRLRQVEGKDYQFLEDELFEDWKKIQAEEDARNLSIKREELKQELPAQNGRPK